MFQGGFEWFFLFGLAQERRVEGNQWGLVVAVE